MTEFEITKVGIKADSLQIKNDVVLGTATIYSKDLDTDLDLEYCDDFNFIYNIAEDFATLDVDDDVFGGYLETIGSMLIDNLKTNFL